MKSIVTICGSIILALSSVALANGDHGHDGDIEVERTGSRLATDGRVFESMFGAGGFPFYTDAPGFEGDPGVFAQGTSIGFNIVSPLGFWNGGGFDDLNPQTQESITASFGPPGFESQATTGAGFVSGFDFIFDAGLGFDVHLDYFLDGVVGDDPADGIYLLALQLTSNNYDASEIFWIVFGNNVSEAELDAAADWVRDNLVPAPGALALLGLTGLMSRTRRRGELNVELVQRYSDNDRNGCKHDPQPRSDLKCWPVGAQRSKTETRERPAIERAAGENDDAHADGAGQRRNDAAFDHERHVDSEGRMMKESDDACPAKGKEYPDNPEPRDDVQPGA